MQSPSLPLTHEAQLREQGIPKCNLGTREKVRTEWTLVTLAYNLKRLFHVGAELAAA